MKKVGILSDIMKSNLVNSVGTSCIEREFFSVKKEYITSIIRRDGFLPIIIPNLKAYNDEFVNLVDGLILVGGADIPAKYYGENDLSTSIINESRFENEINFLKQFIKTNKPILGVCAGMQSINVALGGKMDQFVESHQIKNNTKLEENLHNINIVKNSMLFDILKTDSIITNTAHKQVVRKSCLPDVLFASSFADDGVIESIEHTNHRFCLGVQWHPEQSPNDDSFKIFDAFLNSI